METPKKKKKAKWVTRIPDKLGNMLIATERKGSIVLVLALVKENRKRNIGVIDTDTEGGIFCVKRKIDKHLHRKSNSYGFNWNVLQGTRFQKVRLTDEGGSYLMPKKIILEKGSFLHFSKQGFELQIFLDYDIIRSYKEKKGAF